MDVTQVVAVAAIHVLSTIAGHTALNAATEVQIAKGKRQVIKWRQLQTTKWTVALRNGRNSEVSENSMQI